MIIFWLTLVIGMSSVLITYYAVNLNKTKRK